MRKYGAEWEAAYYGRLAVRLPSWGMNTISRVPDDNRVIYEKISMPYTMPVSAGGPVIEGTAGHWTKFRDVYHPEFTNNLAKQTGAARFLRTAADPRCIGYFVDNELSWGDETSIALGVLSSPEKQPAKVAFVKVLEQRYGVIGKMNERWGTHYRSWEDIRVQTNVPRTELAFDDLTNFTALITRRYFSTIRAAIKTAAPHRLYLGCRFAWANPLILSIAGEYCDVVSFNVYARSPRAKLPLMRLAGDVPYIIGEFHCGALDRGPFHTGLVAVENQRDRAAAITGYVRDCLVDPNIVGCHWFQYIDSPTTGRVLDGENYQNGFLDTADTPYAETVAASRAIAGMMYHVRVESSAR